MALVVTAQEEMKRAPETGLEEDSDQVSSSGKLSSAAASGSKIRVGVNSSMR